MILLALGEKWHILLFAKLISSKIIRNSLLSVIPNHSWVNTHSRSHVSFHYSVVRITPTMLLIIDNNF